MARSDLLVDLVEAERTGDKPRFLALVEAVIAEERAKSHHLVADRLEALITTTGPSERRQRDSAASAVRDLVQEIVPKRRLSELTTTASVESSLTELIEETPQV